MLHHALQHKVLHDSFLGISIKLSSNVLKIALTYALHTLIVKNHTVLRLRESSAAESTSTAIIRN